MSGEQQTQEETENEDTRRETGEDNSTEEEYEQVTMYFFRPTKQKFRRWMKKMELNHDSVFDSNKRPRYEALVRVAMDHEEEFVEELEKIHQE